MKTLLAFVFHQRACARWRKTLTPTRCIGITALGRHNGETQRGDTTGRQREDKGKTKGRQREDKGKTKGRKKGGNKKKEQNLKFAYVLNIFFKKYFYPKFCPQPMLEHSVDHFQGIAMIFCCIFLKRFVSKYVEK